MLTIDPFFIWDFGCFELLEKKRKKIEERLWKLNRKWMMMMKKRRAIELCSFLYSVIGRRVAMTLHSHE
jgi:hypothetical protein